MDFEIEKRLWQKGFGFVAGLDEVGRGPLAGPVCAAAVILNSKLEILNSKETQNSPASPSACRGRAKLRIQDIRDSKKLSANRRQEWYEFLTTCSDIKWGVGLVSEKIIDQINILEATKLAMKRAIAILKIEPDYLLIDGNFLLEDLNVSQKAITRGDEKVFSCAAASIIAKVTRDRLMQKYDQKYPQYGFAKHKGYGTKEHMAAIKKYGACPIHRLSFAPLSK